MVIRVPERVGFWGSGDNSKGCLAAGNLLPAESQTLVLGTLRDPMQPRGIASDKVIA